MTMSNNKMITEFKKIFNCEYFTSEYERLFGANTPTGWFEQDSNLFIINYEYYAKNKSRSLKQAIKYYNIAKETEEFKKYNNCYLIVGSGTKPLKCEIYSTTNRDIKKIGDNLEYLKSVFDNNVISTDETFKDFKTVESMKIKFDPNIASKFNDYLHDNHIEILINKIFFVIIILLCRKYNPRILSYISKKDNGKVIFEYMSKLIKDNCRDKLFTESFDFMKYNLNTEHIYKLIKMLDFDIKFYESDILNQFYSEFMIYDKKGQSKDGIVLTPHDIVEIMVKELNIKKGESVMDCCTGTGTFLIEASRYTDNLIGCEDKEDLYTIAKSNFILHDLDTDKLYYNNCFNQNFDKYDHIILNPPFSLNCYDNGKKEDIYGWRKFDEEQKFIIYQLQYLKENGTGCFIIPRRNFKKANDFKKLLLENCQILKLYNCNDNVFYPNAKIEYIICVFKKCKFVEKYETEIIDYSNDGYVSKNNNRLKVSEPNIKSYKKILYYNNDWNYNKCHYMESIKLPDIKSIYFTAIKNNFLYNVEKYKIIRDYHNITKEYKLFASKEDDLKKVKLREWIEIKIGEYFNIIKVGKDKIFQIKKSQSGIYPLISSSAFDNGIAKFINAYSIDISECITVARNGTAGSCFCQNGKFAITTDIIILKLKEDKTLDLKLFSVLATYFLTKKYSWSNKLSIDKLIEEIIYYPIVEFTD